MSTHVRFSIFLTEAVSCNQYEDEEMDEDMEISCDKSSKEKSKLIENTR